MFWISVCSISVFESLVKASCDNDLFTRDFQVDLAAQSLAAIFVLFVPRVRRPAWRPVRGFLFSFMASSAFYPIICACFVHGYGRMDLEAGATRYALTVIVYLSAVTIYAVRSIEKRHVSIPGQNC